MNDLNYDLDIYEIHDGLVSLEQWAEHDKQFPNCGESHPQREGIIKPGDDK